MMRPFFAIFIVVLMIGSALTAVGLLLFQLGVFS